MSNAVPNPQYPYALANELILLATFASPGGDAGVTRLLPMAVDRIVREEARRLGVNAVEQEKLAMIGSAWLMGKINSKQLLNLNHSAVLASLDPGHAGASTHTPVSADALIEKLFSRVSHNQFLTDALIALMLKKWRAREVRWTAGPQKLDSDLLDHALAILSLWRTWSTSEVKAGDSQIPWSITFSMPLEANDNGATEKAFDLVKNWRDVHALARPNDWPSAPQPGASLAHEATFAASVGELTRQLAMVNG